MATFKIHKPVTLEEASGLLAEYRQEAAVLAGGTDLIPMLKKKVIKPRHLIAINQIRELYTISEKDDTIIIGAMVSHSDIKTSPIIQNNALLLCESSGNVGSVQIQNLGTLVGNLGTASPSADTAPSLLALNAELELIGQEGMENIFLTDFFTGPKTTILKTGQLISSVKFKRLGKMEGSAFIKLGRRNALTISVASAAACVKMNGDGSTIDELHLALGSVAPRPIRAYKVEKRAVGLSMDEVCKIIESELKKEINPISDVRGTKEYRKKTVTVLAKRAVERAFTRVKRI